MAERLKISVYNIIEASVKSDWRGRWFDIFMMVLIITNVIAVIIETIPGLPLKYLSFLETFDTISVMIFSVEYVTRIWVCTENHEEGFEHPIKGRLKHMLTPLALIDLIAIAPFYLAMFVTFDFRFVRIFRMLRLLKLTRYSPAIETFAAVLKSQRRPLGAALLVMMMLLIFASSVVFMFEREAQTDAFACFTLYSRESKSFISFGSISKTIFMASIA